MDVLKILSDLITHIYPGNHTYTEILTQFQNKEINYTPPPPSHTHTQKTERPYDITSNIDEESTSTETG